MNSSLCFFKRKVTPAILFPNCLFPPFQNNTSKKVENFTVDFISIHLIPVKHWKRWKTVWVYFRIHVQSLHFSTFAVIYISISGNQLIHKIQFHLNPAVCRKKWKCMPTDLLWNLKTKSRTQFILNPAFAFNYLHIRGRFCALLRKVLLRLQ